MGMVHTERILVVDDSPTQAKQLAFILQGANIDVETVPDGARALDVLEQDAFDLVLSDVLMPELDGYQLCRAIKEHPRLHHVPVILLTMLNSADDIMKGLSSGADNFITKPYDPHKLLERIRTVCANRRHRARHGHAASTIEFRLVDKDYCVCASRYQILSFLLSTFEDYANAKRREQEALRSEMEHRRSAAALLEKKNQELVAANKRLEVANRSLARLNTELAAAHARLENSYDDLKREQALREIEARRMEMELETARTVQRMLIPGEPPREVPGFEFAFSYRPATEVGGDWLSFHHDPETQQLYIYIGDVTDHGVASALVTAGVFSFFTTIHGMRAQLGHLSLEAQLEALDQRVEDMARGTRFMTFLASRLDYRARTLEVANAGHPSLFLIRASEVGANRWQGIHSYAQPGSQLGERGDHRFPSHTIPLESGDLIVWYTDGVAIGGDDYAGKRRFIRWVREVHDQPLEAIRARLEDKLLSELGSQRQLDDVTFILARAL